MNRIGVIGAGAWGTALAAAVQRAGRQVVIQAREAEVAEAINRDHANPVFLPGVTLDPAIRAITDPARAVQVDAVLLVCPAQALRTVCTALKGVWPAGVPAVICAKGIEHDTCALMSEVVSETLGAAVPVAVLSGPTFAIEVARGLPSAATLACADAVLAERLVDALATPHFRLYAHDDVVGAQMGGAVKNVLAIACGIVEGRGLGDNARAALITRGLAEIARLAVAKGADAQTLMGLSGLGDVTLTCSAMQSRNYSLGVELGRGRSLEAILGERRSVAEGVHSAASAVALAERLGVDVPISAAIAAVLAGQADIDAAIDGLLSRPFRSEHLHAP